jgi:hypothetical protein
LLLATAVQLILLALTQHFQQLLLLVVGMVAELTHQFPATVVLVEGHVIVEVTLHTQEVALVPNVLELMLGQEDKQVGLLRRQQLMLGLQTLVLVFMAGVEKILMVMLLVVAVLVVKATVTAVTCVRTVETDMEV